MLQSPTTRLQSLTTTPLQTLHSFLTYLLLHSTPAGLALSTKHRRSKSSAADLLDDRWAPCMAAALDSHIRPATKTPHRDGGDISPSSSPRHLNSLHWSSTTGDPSSRSPNGQYQRHQTLLATDLNQAVVISSCILDEPSLKPAKKPRPKSPSLMRSRIGYTSHHRRRHRHININQRRFEFVFALTASTSPRGLEPAVTSSSPFPNPCLWAQARLSWSRGHRRTSRLWHRSSRHLHVLHHRRSSHNGCRSSHNEEDDLQCHTGNFAGRIR